MKSQWETLHFVDYAQVGDLSERLKGNHWPLLSRIKSLAMKRGGRLGAADAGNDRV